MAPGPQRPTCLTTRPTRPTVCLTACLTVYLTACLPPRPPPHLPPSGHAICEELFQSTHPDFSRLVEPLDFFVSFRRYICVEVKRA